MLLTKECDYGTRIIRALADGTKKTMAEICDKERIPSQYAYKIIKKLESAKLLGIQRGRVGGYTLSKPLDAVTLYDVYKAVDDNMFVSECLRDDRQCPFKGSGTKGCTVHMELARIQNMLICELQKKTMLELLSEA